MDIPQDVQDTGSADPSRDPRITEIVGVLSSAASTGQELNKKLDRLEENRAKDRRTLNVLTGLVAAKLFTIILLIILFFSLNSIAEKNRDTLTKAKETLAKVDQALVILNECTTDSPIRANPPRKAINKEDEIHECREDGIKGQAGAIGQLKDTNNNGVDDHTEFLQSLTDLRNELKNQ